MSEYPVTDVPAIDDDIPGISIIDYDENIVSDNDIGDRLPELAKWIRSIVQDDNFKDATNIFGAKEPPCHFSYDEVIDGFAAKGFDITIAQAHKVLKRCTAELRTRGMIIKLVDHPEMVIPTGVVSKLKDLIADNTNILLYGQAGNGKTAMVEQACCALGYHMPDNPNKIDSSRVRYFSTATLAPEDFVGIPAPNANDPSTFIYLMMNGFANAEVLILDELNRAHPKVLNGVFQILHGRAINDMQLPKLKSVVAMINPTDEGNYTGAEDLDDALIDRFDHYIEIKAQPSVKYLTEAFMRLSTAEKPIAPEDAQEVAEVCVEWWSNELVGKKLQDQVSPRRLEKMGRAFLLDQGISTTLYKKKTSIPTSYLEQKLSGRALLTGTMLAADPQAVIARIVADSAESMELAIRVRNILQQFYQRQNVTAMASSLPVLEVLDKDSLTGIIERDPGLKGFVAKAAKRSGKEAWLEALYADSEKGQEVLRERRAEIAKQLAAEAANPDSEIKAI